MLLWSAASSKDAALRQKHCLSLVKHLLSPHCVYVSLHFHELKGANSYHQEGIWGSRQPKQSFTCCYSQWSSVAQTEEATKSLHGAPEREQPTVLG